MRRQFRTPTTQRLSVSPVKPDLRALRDDCHRSATRGSACNRNRADDFRGGFTVGQSDGHVHNFAPAATGLLAAAVAEDADRNSMSSGFWRQTRRTSHQVDTWRYCPSWTFLNNDLAWS